MIAPDYPVLTPVGPQAGHIGWLWDVFFAVGVTVAVLVLAALAASTGRGVVRRRRDGDGDPLARDRAQERRLKRVVIGATAVTVVTLIALLVASVRTGLALSRLEVSAPTITITGHQWWWQIEYDDPDSAQRAISANELHVPVGRPIKLRLRSADVIHSFWVPSVHGKKDLIPGRENATWIRVDRPGTYRGYCAEFCGPQHAHMELVLIAEPAAAYQAYLARLREPARSPTTARLMHGRELFVTRTCAMCHAVAGTPAGAGLGPDLTHVASRTTIGAGTLTNVRGNLAGWILDPQGLKPGVRMPPNPMAPDDLLALLDYLESLR